MSTISYSSKHSALYRMSNWNWIARDVGGAVYLFEDEPRFYDGVWLTKGRQLYLDDSKIINDPVLQYIGDSYDN